MISISLRCVCSQWPSYRIRRWLGTEQDFYWIFRICRTWHKKQLARLFHAWLYCLAILKLAAAEVCAPGVLLVTFKLCLADIYFCIMGLNFIKTIWLIKCCLCNNWVIVHSYVTYFVFLWLLVNSAKTEMSIRSTRADMCNTRPGLMTANTFD